MNSIPQKILVVGPAWVGDMVMSQALLKLLKQRYPALIIEVLAPPWSAELLARMPEVNRALVSPFKHGDLSLRARYRFGKSLRAENYDQAIVLPNSFKSALIPFFANIPLRTGWRGEQRYFLLNDLRHLDKNKLPLMVERFVALGLEADAPLPKSLPRPAFQLSSASVQASLKKYQLALPIKSVLVLCPGAEYGPSKRWPANYFAEVANTKLDDDWEVWLMGSVRDQPITREIQQLTHNRCVDLAGQTTLGEVIDLISLATAVVSNDSGLMHIAAALARPLVVIYGSTSAKFTPPLHDPVEILALGLACSPCFERVCPLGHFRCMLDLQPKQVLVALQRLLAS